MDGSSGPQAAAILLPAMALHHGVVRHEISRLM